MNAREIEFDLDSALYTAAVTAELSGVAPRTLLAYESLGVIAGEQTGSGQNRYSERTVRRVRAIRTLIHSNGVNIHGASHVLSLFDVLHAGGASASPELDHAFQEYAGSLD